MAITAEQLREIVVIAMREAASHGVQAGTPNVAPGGSPQGGGGWKKQLDLRAVDGMEIYRGGEVEWVDWMWEIKVQLRPMAPALLELMGLAEKNIWDEHQPAGGHE